MSFRPDRTANLPPRTCPSSNSHAKTPPPTPVGGGRPVRQGSDGIKPRGKPTIRSCSARFPRVVLSAPWLEGEERRSRHDQGQGPRTGEGKSGPESPKARSQRRPARPSNPPRAVRSGNKFDKRPARECQRQKFRRGATGGGTVEIRPVLC
jgi:hypothetical protein